MPIHPVSDRDWAIDLKRSRQRSACKPDVAEKSVSESVAAIKAAKTGVDIVDTSETAAREQMYFPRR